MNNTLIGFMSRRRVPLILGLFLTIAVFAGITYLNSYQYLELTFPDSAEKIKATVYKLPQAELHTDAGDPNEKIPQNMVAERTDNTKLKLPRGYYLVAMEGNGYENTDEQISLQDSSVKLEVNPPLSSKKLDELLLIEKPIVQEIVKNQLGELISGYAISNDQLFARGEWYGGTISQQITDNDDAANAYDTYKFVAHKKDGKWSLVTTPPELIISAPKYPDIPREILVEVNKLY